MNIILLKRTPRLGSFLVIITDLGRSGTVWCRSQWTGRLDPAFALPVRWRPQTLL